MAKKQIPRSYADRAKDVPVTQKMLFAVRDELNSSIKSIDAKAESRFHEMSSQIHQIKILVEEQNAKNNIVLDGLNVLFERQERVEALIRD